MPVLGKRGVGIYVSWILIFAFAVALSALMYKFMIDYTKSSSKDIEKVVINTDDCKSVSLSIEEACFDSGDLRMVLKNRNYAKIDKMNFRFFDADNRPGSTNLTDIPLSPNREKTITLGTGLSDVGFVQVIPIIFREGYEIQCESKKASSTDITTC